ncbi:uncharacterized protein DS421_18g624680 [Arachis hypogaea]|nr:uncharacterized protein DS421_18g624680 [Arachis hypogaea]
METLKEGETVVFTREAKSQEHATEGLKANKDQGNPETAIEHALTEEKESQVDSSLGVQQESVMITKLPLVEMKESQEPHFFPCRKNWQMSS